jgi:hypothetical protein
MGKINNKEYEVIGRGDVNLMFLIESSNIFLVNGMNVTSFFLELIESYL